MNEPAKIPLPRDARLQRYADGIIDCKEGWKAYMDAFPDCRTKASAHTGHKRASKRADVKAYISAVRQQQGQASVLSLIAKREFLCRIMTTPLTSIDPDSPTKKDHDLLKKFKRTITETGETTEIEKLDPLKAIEIDNKLAGEGSHEEAIDEIAEALSSIAGGFVPTEKMT